MEILDSVPFELDEGELREKVRVEDGTADAAALGELVAWAREHGRPKWLYRECFVESRGTDTVTMAEVTFTSVALRRNLEAAERVFVYLATCGPEMDQAPMETGDFLREFWVDSIKAMLLGAATEHLAERIKKRHGLVKSATMSPGSGDVSVWPIEQQRLLFSLLGDTAESIGVELTESFLMRPNKTVSGLRFATEKDFRTCQLCHRENCQERSAAFDAELWASVQE